MSELAEIVASFSNPFAGVSAPTIGYLSRQQMLTSLNRLRPHCANRLPWLPDRLVEGAIYGVSHTDCVDSLWNASLGRFRRSIEQNDAGVLLQSLLELSVAGDVIEQDIVWHSEGDITIALCLGGWHLAGLSAVRITGARGGSPIKVQTDGGNGQAVMTRTGTDWSIDAPQPPLQGIAIATPDGHSIHLRPHADELEAMLPANQTARFCTFPEVDAFAARVQDSIASLYEKSPAYMAWVSNVVREVAPTKNDIPGSASHQSFPAQITLSCDDRAGSVIEMLVHEASHQYFFAAEAFGPFCDDTDDRLYYSPLAGRDRPLEKILLAYHALGNIALVLAACREAPGRLGAYCNGRLADTHGQLRQLAAPLDGNAALTANGNSLWQPLAAQIEDTIVWDG